MRVLTIIGNGFDLGHGLPTLFDQFIEYNPSVYKSKYACANRKKYHTGGYNQQLYGACPFLYDFHNVQNHGDGEQNHVQYAKYVYTV